MSTKREQILDYVKTQLEAVSGINEVTINQVNPVDLETVKLPCIFIYFGRETRLAAGQGVIGYETWELELNLEVWGMNEDMEDLLGKIHTKMHSVETMGGLLKTSYRTGVDMLVIDPEQALQAMSIDYLLIYQHIKGTM